MMGKQAQTIRPLQHLVTFCYVGRKAQSEVAMISIDEFRKIEIKVATIKHAEPHPNADRLMVLKIDLGSEQRQLVAGIKGHYAAEDLIGRQIVVVANLEPATLRGVESQGMLLAATDNDKIVLLNPEKPVSPGARVS